MYLHKLKPKMCFNVSLIDNYSYKSCYIQFTCMSGYVNIPPSHTSSEQSTSLSLQEKC